MRKDAADVAQAARCLSIGAPAQPFNGQQSSHPEAFLTPGIITPLPLRKATKPICLSCFAAMLLGVGGRHCRVGAEPRQDRRNLSENRQPEHALQHGCGLIAKAIMSPGV